MLPNIKGQGLLVSDKKIFEGVPYIRIYKTRWRASTDHNCGKYGTLVSESKLAGSAGTVTSTALVSTATTPTGTPPSLKNGSRTISHTQYHLKCKI